MVALASGDLGAAQTAAALDLDAAGAHSHGAAHGVLHRTAEADALLKLLRDVLGNQLSVRVGRADLDDGESHRLADELFHFLAILLDRFAALADHDAGSGAVNVDADLGGIALDLNGGDAGGIEGLLEILTNLVVFNDQIADLFFSGVPSGIPVFNNADAQAVRIYFLSHNSASFPQSLSATAIMMWLVRLLIRYIRPCARGMPRFRIGPAPT